MSATGTGYLESRGVSETLGVAVLIGMTLLVTAGLGLGVLVIAEDTQEQNADISFTFLQDTLVVVYEDAQNRSAGRLYIEGPDNNVSWAALDEDLGPDEMVQNTTDVRLNQNTAYNAQPADDELFEVIYFTETGDRHVLASVNEAHDTEESPVDPGDTPDPNDPNS
jgi:hypothetical protein